MRAPRVLHRVRLPDLAIGEELGDGGEGTVHAVAGPGVGPAMVLKRYQRELPAARVRQLEHLVGIRAELSLGMRAFAWPETLVVDGDRVAGVLMPRAPDGFWAPFAMRSGAVQRRLREVQYLLFGADKLQRLGVPFATLSTRLELLNGICAALSVLHHHDLVYGDLSARNVVYRTDGELGVFLLDCDGIAARGSAYVIDSPDWTDPAAPTTASPATDVHKLGLLAARVLSVHPTTRRLPGAGGTPRVAAEALAAALEPEPANRPSIDQLATALSACAPGPGVDAGDLPQWGLRPETGELALLSAPPDAGQTAGGAGHTRRGRWRR